MFKSIFGLAGDIVNVVTAPVEIAADLTRAVTKPVAEAVKDIVMDVKDSVIDE